VVEAGNDGTLKVQLRRGKFVSKDLVPGAVVEINGEDFGELAKISAPDSVSFKEIISMTGTKPDWYCCHSWGDSVLNFIACCEEHARLRCLCERTSSYWVCAYANRQHDLEDEISKDDITNTSFFRAMQRAKGVLLFLGLQAKPFERMWCTFEIFKAITSGDGDHQDAKRPGKKNKPLSLDIVTAFRQNNEVHVNLMAEERLPREPLRAKMIREKSFPHHLLVQGMTRNLEDGKCYSDLDKQNIEKFMANGGGPEQLADACKKANQRLHAHFALLSWPFAIENNLVLDFDGDPNNSTVLSLIGMLKEDATRHTLSFSLAHSVGVTSHDIKQVACGLPENLKHLELSFEGCIQVDNSGLQALAEKLPSSITKLHLNLMGCVEISNAGIAWLAWRLSSMSNLEDVRLVCCMCPHLSEDCFVRLDECLPNSVQTCAILMAGTFADKNCHSLLELRHMAQVVRRRKSSAKRLSVFALPGFVRTHRPVDDEDTP